MPHKRIKESVFFQNAILLTESSLIEDPAFTFKVEASENKVEYDLFTHLDTINPDQLESFSGSLNQAAEAMEFFLIRDLNEGQYRGY